MGSGWYPKSLESELGGRLGAQRLSFWEVLEACVDFRRVLGCVIYQRLASRGREGGGPTPGHARGMPGEPPGVPPPLKRLKRQSYDKDPKTCPRHAVAPRRGGGYLGGTPPAAAPPATGNHCKVRGPTGGGGTGSIGKIIAKCGTPLAAAAPQA